jgi:hypothetical protein
MCPNDWALEEIDRISNMTENNTDAGKENN